MAAEKDDSYVRVAREVEATQSIMAYRRRVEDLSFDCLPDLGSTGRSLAKTLDEVKRDGAYPVIKNIRLPAAKVYDETDWRLNLFERRLPTNRDSKFYLHGLMGRLVDLDLDNLTAEPSPDFIPVLGSGMIESTSRAGFRSANYREFSVVLHDSPALTRFSAEAVRIAQQARRPIQRDNLQLIHRQSAEPLSETDIVPVLKVSRRVRNAVVDEFVEAVNLMDAVSFNFKPPELDGKIR